MAKKSEPRDDSKDYIINLRVSRETYEKIKDKARDKKETVSNLVRRTIEDSTEIMRDLRDDIFRRGKKANFRDVVTYQKAQLADDMACDACEKEMKKGDAVSVGESKRGKRYYFCSKCK